MSLLVAVVGQRYVVAINSLEIKLACSNFSFGSLTFSLIIVLNALTLSAQDLPSGAARLRNYEQKYVNRVLDDTKIFALKNFQNKIYAPERGEVFEVKSYWIPASAVTMFEIPSELQRQAIEFQRDTPSGEAEVLLLVHPESEDLYKFVVRDRLRGPKFLASATASSRTLMMWPEAEPSKVFFGKLSLDKEIGGVVRTIPKGEVARSIGEVPPLTKPLESSGFRQLVV